MPQRSLRKGEMRGSSPRLNPNLGRKGLVRFSQGSSLCLPSLSLLHPSIFDAVEQVKGPGQEQSNHVSSPLPSSPPFWTNTNNATISRRSILTTLTALWKSKRHNSFVWYYIKLYTNSTQYTNSCKGWKIHDSLGRTAHMVGTRIQVFQT